MSRPEVLQGYTTKVKVGCGSIFLTLNVNEGKMFEMFINGSKLSGCGGLQQALSRTITLCFKNNIPLEDIIEQLYGISCPACTRAKAKLGKDEVVDFPMSCGDACSRFIKKISNTITHD
jgi:ribonucleoside-diphosphate reductase alpha chain